MKGAVCGGMNVDPSCSGCMCFIGWLHLINSLKVQTVLLAWPTANKTEIGGNFSSVGKTTVHQLKGL